MLCIHAAGAAEPAAPPSATGTLKGEVLEVQDVDSYTYLRLKTKDGETWAAVNKTPLSKGAQVTIENTMVMKNFESKSLKKTFPAIVFGTLGGGAAQRMDTEMAAAHSGFSKAPEAGSVKVPKASGPNARTVSEIVTGVKYNAAIMGKNWVHIRDGSGSSADKTDDVLVTTKSETKVGDVVLVKGVVHTDMDLGSGYAYKVLIEEATLEK
jgi:hypothetical protein